MQGAGHIVAASCAACSPYINKCQQMSSNWLMSVGLICSVLPIGYATALWRSFLLSSIVAVWRWKLLICRYLCQVWVSEWLSVECVCVTVTRYRVQLDIIIGYAHAVYRHFLLLTLQSSVSFLLLIFSLSQSVSQSINQSNGLFGRQHLL